MEKGKEAAPNLAKVNIIRDTGKHNAGIKRRKSPVLHDKDANYLADDVAEIAKGDETESTGEDVQKRAEAQYSLETAAAVVASVYLLSLFLLFVVRSNST